MNANTRRAIQTEQLHQQAKWGGHTHSVAEWLLILEKLMGDARRAWVTKDGDESALHEVRQIAATAIACLDQCGAPERELFLTEQEFEAVKGGDSRPTECPQCAASLIQPRDSERYCEECGWPEENRMPDEHLIERHEGQIIFIHGPDCAGFCDYACNHLGEKQAKLLSEYLAKQPEVTDTAQTVENKNLEPTTKN